MDRQRRFLTSIEWIAEMNKLMEIVENSVNEVVGVAQKTKFDLCGKSGGYFCLQEISIVGMHILPNKIFGKPFRDKERREMAQLYATEKSVRLLHHPEHELSSQSRRPSSDQWGGAVRGTSLTIGGEFILSFAGLPEMLDEVVMLLAAIRWKCMTIKHAKELAAISEVSTIGNTFFLGNMLI